MALEYFLAQHRVVVGFQKRTKLWKIFGLVGILRVVSFQICVVYPPIKGE